MPCDSVTHVDVPFELERTRFTVRTDHELLLCILNLADVAGCLKRLRICILEFDFYVVYCADIKNQAANDPARFQTTSADI